MLSWLGACAEPDGVRSFASGTYPEALSAWGVVLVRGDALALGQDVVPYDLATPLFTDHAHKLRTVWLPADTQAQHSATEVFDFPVGTIVSKTFYYPKAAHAQQVLLTDDDSTDFVGSGLTLERVRLIETRLLVRQADGWDALPYVWNDDQSDAYLTLIGDAFSIQSSESEFTYVVPTRNECASCHASDHTSGALHPIGLAARHLDKVYEHYANGPAPQLGAWVARGVLNEAPPTALPNAVWRAGATDDLEHRARSYLDINCGHCHNPRGAADTSGLFLDRYTAPSRALGICKPPIAAGRGSGGHAFSIVPGSAAASILVFRMAATDPAIMMPELGRSTVHDAGVELVSRWIDSQSRLDCALAPPA